MVEVPIHIELKVKATGKFIRDFEAHIWTFDDDGLVRRFRHLVDTQQYVLATK